jgi:MFS family permease
MRLSIFGLACFFFAVGFGISLFYLPLLASSINQDLMFVGLMVAVPALSSLLVAAPAGSLVDRLGSKVSYAGLFGLIGSALFLSSVSSPLNFIVYAMLLGVSFQLVYVSFKTYVLGLGTEAFSKQFGLFAGVFTAGVAAGPIVGGALASSGVLIVSHVVVGVNILGVILFSLSGVGSARRESLDVSVGVIQSIREYGRLGKVGLIILVVSLVYTAFEGLAWALVPLMESSRISGFETGILAAIFMLPMLFVGFLEPAMVRHYGRSKVLALCFLGSGISTMFFGLSNEFIALVIFSFLAATGVCLAWITSANLFAEKSSNHSRGGLAGVWNMSEELGYLLGPAVGGLIAHQGGIELAFMSMGIVVVIAGTLFVFYPVDN